MEEDASHVIIETTTDISWIDAQLMCMNQYGTTLGTIRTHQDITNANKTAVYLPFSYLFVGLYRDPGYTTEWEWLDRTPWYVIM